MYWQCTLYYGTGDDPANRRRERDHPVYSHRSAAGHHWVIARVCHPTCRSIHVICVSARALHRLCLSAQPR